VWDGLGDELDAPQLQTSRLYDIHKGSLNLRAQWGTGFDDYLREKRAVGLVHVAFLVPSGIDTGQFSTLRQARSMGVKIVGGGTAILGQQVR
jgi:hypothetical protein